MTGETNVRIPTLLLSRDGYEIETVLVGPHAKYTAWVLLHRRPSGQVATAASGWTEGHEEARREAFTAFMEHKEMCAALHLPVRLNESEVRQRD